MGDSSELGGYEDDFPKQSDILKVDITEDEICDQGQREELQGIYDAAYGMISAAIAHYHDDRMDESNLSLCVGAMEKYFNMLEKVIEHLDHIEGASIARVKAVSLDVSNQYKRAISEAKLRLERFRPS